MLRLTVRLVSDLPGLVRTTIMEDFVKQLHNIYTDVVTIFVCVCVPALNFLHKCSHYHNAGVDGSQFCNELN